MINVTIGALFGGVLALLTVYYFICRRFKSERGLLCITLGVVTTILVIGTLILNQITTGLADDQGVLFFWRFANVGKLAEWGALPLVVTLVHDRQSMVSASFPVVSRDGLVAFLIQSFRLDFVWPMFVSGAIVAAPSLLRRRWKRTIATPLAVLVFVTALTFAIIALVAGPLSAGFILQVRELYDCASYYGWHRSMEFGTC